MRLMDLYWESYVNVHSFRVCHLIQHNCQRDMEWLFWRLSCFIWIWPLKNDSIIAVLHPLQNHLSHYSLLCSITTGQGPSPAFCLAFLIGMLNVAEVQAYFAHFTYVNLVLRKLERFIRSTAQPCLMHWMQGVLERITKWDAQHFQEASISTARVTTFKIYVAVPSRMNMRKSMYLYWLDTKEAIQLAFSFINVMTKFVSKTLPSVQCHFW